MSASCSLLMQQMTCFDMTCLCLLCTVHFYWWLLSHKDKRATQERAGSTIHLLLRSFIHEFESHHSQKMERLIGWRMDNPVPTKMKQFKMISIRIYWSEWSWVEMKVNPWEWGLTSYQNGICHQPTIGIILFIILIPCRFFTVFIKWGWTPYEVRQVDCFVTSWLLFVSSIDFPAWLKVVTRVGKHSEFFSCGYIHNILTVPTQAIENSCYKYAIVAHEWNDFHGTSWPFVLHRIKQELAPKNSSTMPPQINRLDSLVGFLFGDKDKWTKLP